MAKIFVDSNIILGFWSLTEGRVSSELLLPLVDLREHILVTQQIVDEINRNKLQKFINDSGSFSFTPPNEFPEHMMRSKEIFSLNSSMKDIRNASKSIKNKWEEMRAAIAEEISCNGDLVTITLEPLLKSAVKPTQSQLEAARNRRERGNPPGKKSDPLGDQISWQQFLDAAKHQSSVWIITRDMDFLERINSRVLLNPFLQSELIAQGVKDIHVFDNLAAAIKALKMADLAKAASLDNTKLDRLESEEAKANYPHPPYLIWPNASWKCPRCEQVNSNSGLSAHPSQYGGWSYWASCSHCGFRFDTGEAYDD